MPDIGNDEQQKCLCDTVEVTNVFLSLHGVAVGVIVIMNPSAVSFIPCRYARFCNKNCAHMLICLPVWSRTLCITIIGSFSFLTGNLYY